MNRILFEKSEIVGGVAKFGGARAAHVLEILHGENGQKLKTGEIDGPVGFSEITDISLDGGEPFVTVKTCHREESVAPWVDIILAPPRPRAMKRLLPQLAAMGAGRIVLAGAKKVEKDFWGATLLKEENFRPLLIDGMMQAGTSILPTLEIRRNFKRFVEDEIDSDFPSRRRIFAHPYAGESALPPPGGQGRLLLAIGPEGGWTSEETSLLESKGFAGFSLGARILKTETAAIALLAVLGKDYDTAANPPANAATIG